MVPLVSSVAQVAAFSSGYGKVRDYDGSGNKLPAGETRVHEARDFYLPPGSPVFTPIDSIFDHWATSNPNNDTSMGWVAVLKGVDGVVYRFIHISVATQNKSLMKGQMLPWGTYLGNTSLHDLGSSPSHVHVDTTKNGVKIDPVGVLGVEGFNRMTHGRSAAKDPAFIAGRILIGATAFGAGFVVARRLLFKP